MEPSVSPKRRKIDDDMEAQAASISTCKEIPKLNFETNETKESTITNNNILERLNNIDANIKILTKICTKIYEKLKHPIRENRYKCTCKNSCTTKKCGCKKRKINCLSICSCEPCQNDKIHF